jgi:hypothetical protein
MTSDQPIAAAGIEKVDEQAESDSPGSAADIAAELANPISTLGSLNFNLDCVSDVSDLPGADDQGALRMTLQPVLPYPLGGGVNLFVSPAIPVIFKQQLP